MKTNLYLRTLAVLFSRSQCFSDAVHVKCNKPRPEKVVPILIRSPKANDLIIFILQLSNQLASNLEQNKIKVLAEVRLQRNDPTRAIRTIKVRREIRAIQVVCEYNIFQPSNEAFTSRTA